MHILFIGLGNMGGPMARNLHHYATEANHTLSVNDINTQALAAAQEDGLITVPDGQALHDAASKADVVITMLPAGTHVQNLYTPAAGGGLLSAMKPGTLAIDCSTISAHVAQRVHDACASRQIDFLDAPVSGGVGGARAGTLTFMIGGKPETFEQAKPLLQAMGKNLFHAGAVGAGQVAKICNNMLAAVQMSATSEALALGMRNGLDPAVLSNIMKESSGGNWALNVYNPVPDVMANVPSNNHYQGGFMVKLMLKDLKLAMQNALDHGTSIPLGALARDLYAMHANRGNEDLDFASIYQLYADGAEPKES